MYSGGFVFGGGDEVGAVRGHLQVRHLHALFVCFDVFEEFAGLDIPVSNFLAVSPRGLNVPSHHTVTPSRPHAQR